MEAVCHGKRWDVALAYDDGHRVIGALPYLWGKKMGLRYVVQPQLTQYNGPWYASEAWRRQADLQFRDHLKSLRLALYQQNFSPRLSEVADWPGYTVARRVTYRIEDISDPQRVFEDFDKSRRQRQIRRAEKVLAPDAGITPSQFAQFHTHYWQTRGQKDLLSVDFMVRVIETSLQRSQGILIGVRDGEGVLQGARFVAFDENCGYALLSALHPRHPNGTSALLFWLILQQLSGRCKSFDFEGSMDRNIAFSYSLYGAKPSPYVQLTRYCHPLIGKVLKI